MGIHYGTLRSRGMWIGLQTGFVERVDADKEANML